MSAQNGCSPATFLIETESRNTWANSEQNMAVTASDGPSPHSPSLRLGLPAPQPWRRHHAQSLLGPSFHKPRTHHVLESQCWYTSWANLLNFATMGINPSLPMARSVGWRPCSILRFNSTMSVRRPWSSFWRGVPFFFNACIIVLQASPHGLHMCSGICLLKKYMLCGSQQHMQPCKCGVSVIGAIMTLYHRLCTLLAHRNQLIYKCLVLCNHWV